MSVTAKLQQDVNNDVAMFVVRDFQVLLPVCVILANYNNKTQFQKISKKKLQMYFEIAIK